MVKRWHLIIMWVASYAGAALVHAQSPQPTPPFVTLQYPNAEISDVLHLYGSLSHRKVWVELGVRDRVTVWARQPIPVAEALSLIRGSLLERGIEIRDAGESEAFVSRVTNPVMQSLMPSPTASPK